MSVELYTRPKLCEPVNTAPPSYSRQAVSRSDVDAESNMLLVALIIVSSVAAFLLVYTWTL